MNAAPKWFRPVAVAALLWNLLGCLAFVSDLMVTPEKLSKMTAAQQALLAARPAWAIAATACAVFGGALGSLGLMLFKRWGNYLLVISLVGVIAQDIGLFGLTDASIRPGAAAMALQGLVFLIALLLVNLGRKANANGWLA